jgi:hypothetical protein
VIGIYILLVFIAYLLISMWRNHVTWLVHKAFLDDPTLYPRAFEKLPSGNEMVFHPKHWFRCTKLQWAIYVGEWERAK